MTTIDDKQKAIARIDEISQLITAFLQSGLNSANDAMTWITLQNERSNLKSKFNL